MSCKHPWDRTFIFRALPPSLVHGELKKQRAEVLLEREKALLPGTSQIVSIVDEYQAISELLKEKRKALAALKKEIKELELRADNLRWEKNDAIAALEGNARPIRKDAPKKPTNNMVCPCPTTDCRGYIFSDHKCTICPTVICKDCHVPVDPETEHTCKADDLATVKLIKKECKPCPNCGAPSRKTEGCSQVWCLMCHKAWNWNTQQIEDGEIHATDYFNYMRRNGTALPRRVGDVPAGAVPCEAYRLRDPTRALKRWSLPDAEDTFFMERYQLVCEFRREREPDVMSSIDLRLKYLKGEIDETKWKQMLHKRDKENTFKTELYRMRAAYGQVMTEWIQSFSTTNSETEVKASLEAMHKMHDLMEEEYSKVAKCFNSKRKSPFVR
jgi:hypothetical protein